MILASALSYTYPVGIRPALRDITLSVGKGELILVTGPTAAGKTTLCYALSGILQHEFGGTCSGYLALNGRPVNDYTGICELNQLVSMVFDDADSQLIFTSVEEELASGLETRIDSKQEIEDRVSEVMELCGITHLRERPPIPSPAARNRGSPLLLPLRWIMKSSFLTSRPGADVVATTRIIKILQDLKTRGRPSSSLITHLKVTVMLQTGLSSWKRVISAGKELLMRYFPGSRAL